MTSLTTHRRPPEGELDARPRRRPRPRVALLALLLFASAWVVGLAPAPADAAGKDGAHVKITKRPHQNTGLTTARLSWRAVAGPAGCAAWIAGAPSAVAAGWSFAGCGPGATVSAWPFGEPGAG